MFVRWGFNFHARRHSSCVESSPWDTLHSARPPASPPPHGRLLCSGLLPEHLQCFFIRMLKAGAKRPSTDSSPFLFSYYFGMVEQFHRHRWKYPLKISQVTKFESNLSVDNLDLQSHKIWQMLSLWKWGREFVLPPPPHHQQKRL